MKCDSPNSGYLYGTATQMRLSKNMRVYRRKSPWQSRYWNIVERCTKKYRSDYYRYGGKGIKCLITPKEIKELWFRDKAYEMKKPSIDRIDSNGHYEYSNCRFIEILDNVRRSRTSTLNPEKVREIRVLLKKKISTTIIMNKYGVGRNAILKIKWGESWKDVK